MRRVAQAMLMTSLLFGYSVFLPRDAFAQPATNFCSNSVSFQVRQAVESSLRNEPDLAPFRFPDVSHAQAHTNRIALEDLSVSFFQERATYVGGDISRWREFRDGGRQLWINRLATIAVGAPGGVRPLTLDERLALTSSFTSLFDQLCPRPSFFGDFSFPLPGLGKSIDALVEGGAPMTTLINVIVRLVIAFIVAVAVIMVVMAGYFYMTAGGNAQRVAMAKALIVSAIGGIILALVAFILLNTISPQFASDLAEPKLQAPTK